MLGKRMCCLVTALFLILNPFVLSLHNDMLNAVSLSAFADSNDSTDEIHRCNEYEYQVFNGKACITSYTGNDKDVIVPAELDGYRVAEIGQCAFDGSIDWEGTGSRRLTNMETLTFSEGIEYINSGFAFQCQNLRSVTLPASCETPLAGVNTIYSGGCFTKDCPLMEFVNVDEANPYLTVVDGVLYSKDMTILVYYPTNLKKDVFCVPDTVTMIDDSAFEYASQINKVKLPDSVSYIGYWSFNNSSLKDINIPAECSFIGQYAFQGIDFESIVFPSGYVGDIFVNAFDLCTFKELIVEEGNPRYSMVNDAFIDSGEVIVFYKKDSRQTVFTVPEGIVCIRERAFSKAENLQSITLPKSLTYIGEGAFEECTNLRDVTIECEMTEIPDSMFQDCCSLEQIKIPESVETINRTAFYGCEFLKSANIPESVKEIGDFAFADCPRLLITVPNTVETVGDNAFQTGTRLYCYSNSAAHNYAIEFSKEYVLEYRLVDHPELYESPFEYIVKNNSEICITGYNDWNHESVVIPQKIEGLPVTEIADKAFYYNSWITDIDISAPVKKIGDAAFYNCISLKKAKLPNTLKEIGVFAFVFCESLERVNIPDSIEEMHYGAFDSCDNLTLLCSLGSYGQRFAEERSIPYRIVHFTESNTDSDTTTDTSSDTETDISTDITSDTESNTETDDASVSDTDTSSETETETDTDTSTASAPDTPKPDFKPDEKKDWSPKQTDGLVLDITNAEITDLTEVAVNGEKTDPNNYTVTKTESGVVITLNPEFLKTLASGSYKMCAVFSNGTAETQITVENTPEPIGSLGDLDNDGAITANDALIILRVSVGLAELTPDETKLADVDGDTEIAANDALAVLRYSAGLADENSPINKPITA